MKNILVVDDEVTLAKNIKLYLEKGGYGVIMANSGK